MQETGKLPCAAPAQAEGRVTLEYTDGLTGRVKERIRGKNHVFPGGLMLGGLPYLLGNNDGGYSPLAIYLSDYAGALDTGIPLIPGNIIGYGKIGSAASGAYLGAENTAARALGVYSGGRFHYKRQWSWVPSQVPGTIRKIGLTPRMEGMTKGDCNNLLLGPLPIAFADGGNGFCDYDNQRYSILYGNRYGLNDTLVGQYTFGSATVTNIKWPDLVTIDDFYSSASYGPMCWFIDRATHDMHLFYVYQSKATSMGRKRVYKMLHAWFDGALSQRKGMETVDLGTEQVEYFSRDLSTSQMYGLLSDGVYHLPYSMDGTRLSWCRFDPAQAGNGDFSACFSKVGDLLLDGSYSTVPPTRLSTNSVIALRGSRVSMCMSDNSRTQYVYQFKPGGAQLYGVKVLYGYGAYSDFVYGLLPWNLGGTDVLAAFSPPKSVGEVYADKYERWGNYSDLTCYSLPADAPVRQEGQGVSVTYEIALGY